MIAGGDVVAPWAPYDSVIARIIIKTTAVTDRHMMMNTFFCKGEETK